MPDITPFLLGCIGAFSIGALMATWGIKILHGGRLHTRQGAAVLVGAAVVLGVFMMLASVTLVIVN